MGKHRNITKNKFNFIYVYKLNYNRRKIVEQFVVSDAAG